MTKASDLAALGGIIATPVGTAPGYVCRAWVNFNGTANTNLSGTYSQSGTTVTVTATAHGLIAGNVVYSDITTGTAVDGTYTVTAVTDANTFTYTAGTSLTTSGNITLILSTIRGSGNVSSIADSGTGVYTVNLATALPDTNAAAVMEASFGTPWGDQVDNKECYLASSSTVQIGTYNAPSFANANFVYVAVFR